MAMALHEEAYQAITLVQPVLRCMSLRFADYGSKSLRSCMPGAVSEWPRLVAGQC